MSSARANANQALYLAKILHHSWHGALAAQELPLNTLNQAFLPAVRGHLQRAYGWFLLELAGADTPADGPPRRCEELPPVPAGRAVPGELRELARLETEGFLAGVLATEPSAAPAATRRAGLVAARVDEGPDHAQVGHWIADFESMCERMRNSLDEC